MDLILTTKTTMALARMLRVLSPATKGFITVGNQSYRPITCNTHTTPLLLERLIQEPISRIKASLDFEEKTNSTFKAPKFSWDTLLTSLRSSSNQKAQLVVEWRLEKLIKECDRNPDSYSDVIHLCGKIQNLQFAMRVFTLMENHSIKPTSSVFNALISASMSSGNIITAISLFETMQSSVNYKPNCDTFTAFISGYGDLGNEKSMICWYKAKLASGFSADIQTYEGLIKGFIKSKNISDASKFFEEMIASGIVPNTSVLQIMIMGFIELRSLNKVEEFWMLIHENGWEINVDMARVLVGFYYEVGIVGEMKKVLEMVTKMSQDLEVLSQFHNGLIKMYARLDRLDDVEYSVGRMLRNGMVFGCADDVEKVISAYFRQGAYDRLDIFLECIKDCYALSRSTYDLLIAGYRRGGLYEKMEMVVKDMKVAGVS